MSKYPWNSADIKFDHLLEHPYNQQYLNSNYSGTTIGQTTTFYGYYMMQVLKGTNVYGMMTVNGQTGQVLYCSWLGTFMQRTVIG